MSSREGRKRVAVYVSAAEYEALRRRAFEERTSISALGREGLVLAAAGFEAPGDMDAGLEDVSPAKTSFTPVPKPGSKKR
jgi:hypothetical protein